MKNDLAKIFEEIREADRNEQTLSLHHRDCKVVFEYVTWLQKTGNRQEWAIFFLVLALFWSFWFLWSYSATLRLQDRAIQQIQAEMQSWGV